MSEHEWASLRVGDIVIERRSKTPRIVLRCTQRSYNGRVSNVITLRKLSQSWTWPCEFTTLFPADWAPRLDRAYRRARVTRQMLLCPRHGTHHFDGGDGAAMKKYWERVRHLYEPGSPGHRRDTGKSPTKRARLERQR